MSPLARSFWASVVFLTVSSWPSRAQKPEKPVVQNAAPPAAQPQQGKKPPVGPAAPQSTHYPILLLIEGSLPSVSASPAPLETVTPPSGQPAAQAVGAVWSLRIGQKGPERMDRTGYPPIPLEPTDVNQGSAPESWTYNAKDSQTGATVTVHLTREPCVSPTSTGKLAFTATAEHSQIGTLQGCGRVATELFPKINNQPTDEDDYTKDKPAPPTITHFKAPTAIAYTTAAGRMLMKRGSVARSIPGKDEYQPSLSHDGKRLLYTVDGTGGERTIYLYDWTTSKASVLLTGTVQEPFWSPDDMRIAFLKFDGAKWQVWVMPSDAPEKAALFYPGDETSLEGWTDEHTILASDLRTLSWIGDDGTVKQALTGADLYGKGQFGMSSANTVRIHPLNPDLLLVSAELAAPLPATGAGNKGGARNDESGPGMAIFLYEIRSKRRVILSPPNLTCSHAEWSRDGLQIFFTGRESSNKAMTVYRMFWDGTSQVKVHDGYGYVIGQ